MAGCVWKKITIETSRGLETAIAPLVLSASRATDIPAFHGDWFMDRLAKGYFRWINPYNRREQLVSTSSLKAIVFWTKNPAPIIPWLPELNRRNLTYYFQFTLNDYEPEDLEPYVPLLTERIRTFRILAEQVGSNRLIWRFDPLIRTPELTPDKLFDRIQSIGDRLCQYTKKLVFSFADINRYAKVRRRMSKMRANWQSFSAFEMTDLVLGLSQQCRDWNIDLASCAEKNDFSSLGVSKNRCIDPDLLAQLTDDPDFLSFLGYERTLFGIQKTANSRNLIDSGQRTECQCMVSKDIGAYNTCRHGCQYCYAAE